MTMVTSHSIPTRLVHRCHRLASLHAGVDQLGNLNLLRHLQKLDVLKNGSLPRQDSPLGECPEVRLERYVRHAE
jgi:hypothetical protein